MTESARFGVLGCECGEYWIVEQHTERVTVQCPRCETSYLSRKRAVLEEADNFEVAAELRARLLARDAGELEAFLDTEDYAELDRNLDWSGSKHFDAFEEDAEAVLGRFEDAFWEADEALGRDDRKYEEAVEALWDRPRAFEEDVQDFHGARYDPVESDGDQADELLEIDAPSDHLVLSNQPEISADASATIGTEACTSPRDLNQQLWSEDQSLVETLFEALDELVGDQTRGARAARLVDEHDVRALEQTVAGTDAEHHYATVADYALDGGFERQRLVNLTRQLGSQTQFGQTRLDDVVTGPVRILAAAPISTPTVAIDARNLFDLQSTQRAALLRHLRRLTPGVRVRIIGSRTTLWRLIKQHADELPTSVIERTKSRLLDSRDGSRSKELRQRARGLVEEVGRDHIDWRRVMAVYEAEGETMSYDRLQSHPLADFSSRAAVRQFVSRMSDRDVLEALGPSDGREVRLLPMGLAAIGEHPDVDLDAEDAPLVRGGSTDVVRQQRAQDDPDQTTVSDPPKDDDSTVYSHTHGMGGGDGHPAAPPRTADRNRASDVENRPTEAVETPESDAGRDDDEADAVADTGRSSSSDRKSGYSFLDFHEHHGAAAVADDGEIGLVNRELTGSDEDEPWSFSYDSERDEIVVDVLDSTKKAVTAVRLCEALLSDPALHQVLTVDRLAGGKDRSGLAGLPIDNPYVLRAGACTGYLRNVDATAKRYRDRLRSAKDELVDMTPDLQNEDGSLDEELASEVLRKAHGLLGTVTRLYDMLGVDIRRKIRVPSWSVEDEDRRDHLAKMVAKQSSISARYGVYSAHRVLHELREDKREQLLGTPDVDASDPSGDVIGSWVLVGPDVDSMEPHLDDLDDHLSLQEDGENFAPFRLDVHVRDGNRRQAFATAASRLCSFKNLDDTQSAISVLQTIAGDPLTAAAAVGHLGHEDDHRDLDIYEVRRGLQRALMTGAIDEIHILPDLGSGVVSDVVAGALEATEPLAKADLADLAGVTTAAMDYRPNEDAWDILEAAGLLEREDLGCGMATLWRLRLPFESERHEDDRVTPLLDAGKTVAHLDEPRLSDEIAESIYRLTDEIGHEFDRQLHGTTLDMEAFTGPPEERDLTPMLQAYPNLWPLVELVASLLDQDLRELVDETINSSPSYSVQIGRDPSPATTQSSLQAAATPSD